MGMRGPCRPFHRAFDPSALLRQAAASVWAAILDGRAADRPELLASFWLVTHADLKRYTFAYWMLVPALKLPAPITLASNVVDIETPAGRPAGVVGGVPAVAGPSSQVLSSTLGQDLAAQVRLFL
jgi:hypothetical protein